MIQSRNLQLSLLFVCTLLCEFSVVAGPRIITGALSLKPSTITVADLDINLPTQGRVLFEFDYKLSRKIGGNNALVLFLLCAQDRMPSLNDFSNSNSSHVFFSTTTSEMNPPQYGSLQVRMGSSNAISPDLTKPAYCHAQLWIGGQWGIDAATFDVLIPAAQ